MDLVLLILIFTLPVLFIALIVRAISRLIGTRPRGVALDYELRLSSGEALDYLAPHVESIVQTAGFRPLWQAPAEIVYSRKYRPAWVILLAILLCPLGLLLLLVKQQDFVSLSVLPRDGRSRAAVSGKAPRDVRDRLQSLLEDVGERQAAPGWYQWEAGAERYWDGEEWSDETRQQSLPYVVGPRMRARQRASDGDHGSLTPGRL